MATKCLESLLVYGISGAGKTTQVGELAVWVHEKLHKKTRLVSCSGGGWTSIKPAVDAGIVQPLSIYSRESAVETLDKLTKGYWPCDTEDPTAKLVPPEEQKDWGEVGALCFDSLTESCDWMMTKLLMAEAAGKIKISALSMSFRDGTTTYAAPAMSHYGNVQERLSQFIAQSKQIGDRYCMWTALELKASDDNTRLPLYGPDVIGKAKTAKASAWFDNTLHLHLSGGGLKKGVPVRRLYFNTHFEDDGIPYIAKNRGHYSSPMSKLVDNKDYLEGDDASVYKFLQLLEKSHESALGKFKDRLAGLAPGVRII